MSAVPENGASGDTAAKAIDPAHSACVLIGVDSYDALEPLPSVRHNLAELTSALSDPEIWGLPAERIITVENPETAAALVGPIREAAALATDTLIIYYAGHGLLHRGRADQLHLTLPDSVVDRPETTVADELVRDAIRDGSADRRVLLLDCCYSGRVLKGEMSVADQGVRASGRALKGVTGAYVMTSTSADRTSHAPDPKRCTAFTGEFVDVLRTGVADGPEMLGLHTIYRAVRERMERLNLPRPQEPMDRDDGGVGSLPFARNVAVLPPLRPPVPDGPPSAATGGRARSAMFAGGLALGLAAGLAVPPVWSQWREFSPQAAGGPCSERATLLDYSDALDKTNPSGERLRNLSALALMDSGRALAVTDNETARVFPIDLGSAEDLGSGEEDFRPEADRATTLRTPPGGVPSEWFDAEGLVVEQGGETVLVASETGPSIRRFRLDTGEQVGDPLPVPPEFHAAPRGYAQAGRTLESLAASPDGRHLYTALEGPLAIDGDTGGRHLLRILRYSGEPGGHYEVDRQYAYQTSEGMLLSELAVVGDDRLLALERQYVAGLGNAIRVHDVSLGGARPIDDGNALYDEPVDVFTENTLLFDLAECPSGTPGAVPSSPDQSNPLLQNVEGMALGEAWTSGPEEGRRPLYLIADDNNNDNQITRLYALSVDVS
ncbi:esterase-like activity of phytase family protein [Nocardiopsis mangrovi]|uniref:Esterase-like activity of phytase family protein n=1 Tax=Nocardiopsis mangrovi TaxID=1179818 RepID=A0ABV9DYE6_9ACTN